MKHDYRCPACGKAIPKNSPTSYASAWCERLGAWVHPECVTLPLVVPAMKPGPDSITVNELDRHAPLWQILTCLRKAHLHLSDNENVYMDNPSDTSLSLEELDVIINHMQHGNEWSAIQYSDSFDDSDLFTCQHCGSHVLIRMMVADVDDRVDTTTSDKPEQTRYDVTESEVACAGCGDTQDDHATVERWFSE